MRKIEKNFNELMLIALIAFVPLAMMSCKPDECTELVTAQLKNNFQSRTGNLELTEDMSFSGDKVFHNVELNGYTLTVTGNLNINGNVEGGGNIFVNGDLVVSGNVKEANLRADLKIIVNGNVEESTLRARTGSLSISGNVEESSLYYCTTKTINGNVEDTTINRTCDTLSSGGGVSGSTIQVEVPCGTEEFVWKNGQTYKVVR